MSIWHKSVENLLVINAEEGKKRILGVLRSLLLAVPRSCSWRRSFARP